MGILDELEESYEKELCRKADMARIPLGGTFELLPLCNMECRMCYIEQNKKEVMKYGGLKDIDFWLNIAKDAVEQGMLYLLITGGEPFLYPDFLKLYLELKKLGLHIVINTNGTLLTEQIIQVLEENPPRRLNISLYGSSFETYQRLCKHGENFEKVMHNLERLKESRILVRLHTVFTPDNIDDYDGIAAIANSLEMPLGVAYYMFPSLRKGDVSLNHDARFTPYQAAQVKLRHKHDSSTYEEFHQFINQVPQQLLNYKNYPYYGCESITCRAAISSFWINWKGIMTPCGMMDNPCVDLNQMHFSIGWEILKKEADEIRISKECACCDKRQFCNVCIASTYAETGSYDQLPKYICELTNHYIDLIKEEIHKGEYNE